MLIVPYFKSTLSKQNEYLKDTKITNIISQFVQITVVFPERKIMEKVDNITWRKRIVKEQYFVFELCFDTFYNHYIPLHGEELYKKVIELNEDEFFKTVNNIVYRYKEDNHITNFSHVSYTIHKKELKEREIIK